MTQRLLCRVPTSAVIECISASLKPVDKALPVPPVSSEFGFRRNTDTGFQSGMPLLGFY